MIRKILHTLLSISGFVPEHSNLPRTVLMLASFFFSVYILPQYRSLPYALLYFTGSTVLYIGIVYTVLSPKGFRLNLINKFGEEQAYLYYEGVLGFAFFHNGISLSHISQSTANLYWCDIIPHALLLSLSVLLFIAGFATKIWAAYIAGIPVYYYKDMFLGRKISNFVVKGPYRFLSNPMYGVGQLQVYAIAIYYHSVYGLLFGLLNQALVFSYYYLLEKPFICRTYLQPGLQVQERLQEERQQ